MKKQSDQERVSSVIPDMGVRKNSRFVGNKGGRHMTSYCPVTSNLPTKMGEPAFRKRCAIHMAADDGYCPDVCQGKILPDGLEFIKLEVINKETAVGYKQTRIDKCALCNRKKSIFMHMGKEVCGGCAAVRAMANSDPKLVIAALQEFGNMPDAVTATPPQELLEENNRLKSVIKILEKDIADQEQNIAGVLLTTTPAASPIDDIAWKLAEGIIAGTVSGITIADIRAIRCAA